MISKRLTRRIRKFWGNVSRPQGRKVAEAPAVIHTAPSTESDAAGSDRLLEISRAAVALADLGPRLVALASDLQGLAHGQAHQTVAISNTTAKLAEHLRTAVKDLRSSSVQVEQSLSTVGRIAESTKLISINASIEAARAGNSGRAFGVVVGEIQRLSEESGGVTKEIETRVTDMHSSIVRVEGVAGDAVADAQVKLREGEVSVATVNEGVKSLADAAGRQLNEAKSLREIGSQMHGLADRLLRSVGGFRFEIHVQAEKALAVLVDAMHGADSRETREALMTHWLATNPAFELVYATRVDGTQDVDNLMRKDDGVVRDPSGFGKDWSRRPWFLEALNADGVVCSDLYQSAATGDYCFTVSARLVDLQGSPCGVVAADVNFRRLLEA
ncbi:MAG: methyl-accepting chemotaxis protein [Opitutaceae bacterium]|nr:methyl-accepting chemotaxis protein [Opitutaceae bacterium]